MTNAAIRTADKPLNLAVNGLGRVGRLVVRSLLGRTDLRLAAVNDVAPLPTLAYLLRHDTEHGRLDPAHRIEISPDGTLLLVDGRGVPAFSEADAGRLPWGELGIDLVVDCTGAYTSRIKAHAHLDAGAGRVLVSAAAGADVPTVVYGINHATLTANDRIVSAASCSTVGLAPLARALNAVSPIEQGIATTIHALTPTQMVLDNPQRKGDPRRSRTALTNIIPTTAAAAQAVGLVIPELAGKLTGSAIRVPVTAGSLITLHASVRWPGSGTLKAETLNAAMHDQADELFGYTDEPLVSSDFAGTAFESVFDATQTKVAPTGLDRYLVEVAAWFDNETSYVAHLMRLLGWIADQRWQADRLAIAASAIEATQ